MSVGQQIRPARAEPSAPAVEPRRRRPSGEVIAYGVLAVLLGALVWSHVSEVDAFYMDEFVYVHGAEYISDNLPGALVGSLPEWNRGPQRLYSTLLAIPYGLFDLSTAFDVGHFINVALLLSGIVPLALLARRVIDSPALRVLAVALAIAVPWLMISAHLLTENLAFPLFLWAVYGFIRAAEEPSPRTQILALAVVGALALCRVNLSAMFGALVLAVVAAEARRRRDERSQPLGAWLRAALRREAIVVTAFVIALVASLVLLRGSAGSLGAYGGFTLDTIWDDLFGVKARETRITILTYTRDLAVGTFVLPFALGLAATLGGAAGRLPRRMFVPAVVVLGAYLAVIVFVSAWTKGAALEERYAFYPAAPLVVLGVAGLQHLPRLRGAMVASALITLWAMVTGIRIGGEVGSQFFYGPGGAFWGRVLDARLERWEADLLGWTLITPTGWLLVAIGLGATVGAVWLARRRPRIVGAALAAGLVLCGLAQVASLDYGFKQELHGTKNAPGGIALAEDDRGDRPRWIDAALEEGQRAAVVPAVPTTAFPGGGSEVLLFWNDQLDGVVNLRWNGTPITAAPGIDDVITKLDRDGLAEFRTPRPPLILAHPDDPRAQFATGEPIARQPDGAYELLPLEDRGRAVWTMSGMEGDGSIVSGASAPMAFDRAAAPDVRAIEVTVAAPPGMPEPTEWLLQREDRTIDRGFQQAGTTRVMRLRVPRCPAGGPCEPMRWRLIASGPGLPLSFPAYGPPQPPRPVLLQIRKVEIPG